MIVLSTSTCIYMVVLCMNACVYCGVSCVPCVPCVQDLETLLSSPHAQDWVEISRRLLGPLPEGFQFVPKHKSNSYASPPVVA